MNNLFSQEYASQKLITNVSFEWNLDAFFSIQTFENSKILQTDYFLWVSKK